MNAVLHAFTRGGQEWPIEDDDPFISRHRLPGGTAPGQVSRFGAARWDLALLSTGDHQKTVSLAWDPFPPDVRPSFRRAGWALVNLPTPEELLERAWTRRVKWISPATMRSVVSHWRQFAAWLTDRGISRLADVDQDDLEDYAGHVAGLKRRRQKTAEILASISLLWGFAPHLPSGDRIPMPPWESSGLRDYLPADEATNENTTPPIHPAVMSPLLIWALRFVEDFADDILAAWEERQRLIGQIPDHPDPAAARRLRALIEQHIAQNRPLPGGFYLGQLFAARTYLAAITGATEQQTKVALRDHGRGLPVSSQTPLSTAIWGQLHGRPWKPHINFNEAPVLMRRLAAAAMILVIYLSGMRPGEALNLRAGCCPEPADDGSSSVRHEIRGNFYKGARGEDEKIVPGGLPRQTPWTVILPVVHAIRVLERMAEGHLLFPVKTAWAKATPGNRTRPGLALHCQGAQHRIMAFVGPARHSHTRRRGRPEAQQAHPQAHRPQGPLQRRTPRPRRCPRPRTPAPRRDRRPDQEDHSAERGTRPVPDSQRDLRASNKRPHHRERQPPPGHRETPIIQRHITAVPALNLPRSVKPPGGSSRSAQCGPSSARDPIRRAM